MWRCSFVNLEPRKVFSKIKMCNLLFSLLMVHTAWAFIELYETEHAQQKLAEDAHDMVGIAQAKQLLDKMKDGVGGSTVAIHHPSGRRFIHRNRWIMTCNGDISTENGHCNGNALESLTAFKPEDTKDYCYIKSYHSINETLCLSSHPVKLAYENNTVVCEGATDFFPALALSIDDYLKICEGISTNVTYIYYANKNDPDHVEIPNENPHIKCDNEVEGNETNSTKSVRSQKVIREFSFAINKTDICVFTEDDKMVLKLLQYLQL